MKAAIYNQYGPPEVIQIMDTERPVPNDNGVLIRVRAASVNPYDWRFMRGLPYPLRLMAGLRKPKVTRLGADVSGHVEAVGKNVTQFKPGDEVFGACSGQFSGAFAEYACAPETAFVLKPDNLTFEQAASVPIAALTALQALRDKANIQPGHKVLINGAAGGVGTFGVQIAKFFGAQVTAVCSTGNLEMVRSIGADQVIDYTQRNFTKIGQRYDIILDNVGNHSLSACRRALNTRGVLVMAGGQAGNWMLLAIARTLAALVSSWFSSQKLLGILAKLNQQDLTVMGELIATGKVTPIIDKRYRLTEVPEAIRHVETGHARGKTVIILE
jgi:NADPH:quinone reductase-like Zn-dependent oxidoreductase